MSTHVPKKSRCPCGNPQPLLGEDPIYCSVECSNCGRQGEIAKGVTAALTAWNSKVHARATWERTATRSTPDPFPPPLPLDLWVISKSVKEAVAKATHLSDEELGKKLGNLGRRMLAKINEAVEASTSYKK